MARREAKDKESAGEIQYGQHHQEEEEEKEQSTEAETRLERFECEFFSDFQDIGMSLDVDDEGRLLVQEVDGNGEANKHPSLRQADLQIVAVGIPGAEKENAADELLRQLMKSPRPVRVEFARTIPTTTVAVSPSSTTVARGSWSRLKNGAPLQETEAATTQPPPSTDVHSGCKKERHTGVGKARGAREVPKIASKLGPTIGADREKSGTITGRNRSPVSKAEGHNEDNMDRKDDGRAQPAWEVDKERHRRAATRPRKRVTPPSGGWPASRDDTGCPVIDNDDENARQRPREARKQDGEGIKGGGDGTPQASKGTLGASQDEDHLAPQRPQRHDTLPQGGDWEENLRRGRGGLAVPQAPATVSPAAVIATAGRDDESEETSWSVAEQATCQSSPTNQSRSPQRSFHSPAARRSQLVLTPNGSDSSAWSRVPTDGVDSIQRWLQDDSDNSDREGKTFSPRHSWYATSRLRGGQASDVKHSPPSASPTAPAVARTASQSPAVSKTGAAAAAAASATGGGAWFPVEDSTTTGTSNTTTARAAIRSWKGGGGLPNAVSARQHRSPSWCQRADSGHERGSAQRKSHRPSDVSEDGGAGGEIGGDAAVADACVGAANGTLTTNAARFAAAANGAESKKKTPAVSMRGGSNNGHERSSKSTPRTGGVSARLHRSPSRILKGGATLISEKNIPSAGAVEPVAPAAPAAAIATTPPAPPEPSATPIPPPPPPPAAAAAAAPLVVHKPPPTQADPSEERAVRQQISRASVTPRGTRNPRSTSSRTSDPKPAALSSRLSLMRGKNSSEVESTTSSSLSDTNNQQRTGENASSASKGVCGSTGTAQSRAKTTKRSEGGAKGGADAVAVAISDQHSSISIKGEYMPTTTSTKGHERAASAAKEQPKALDARSKPDGGSEGSTVQTNAVPWHPQQQQQARADTHRSISLTAEPRDNHKTNNRSGSGIQDDMATAVMTSQTFLTGSGDGSSVGAFPSSLINYKPFSWRPKQRRTLSEGVMLGRGRSTPLRPSFFHSLPEEEEPPPLPPPRSSPPSLALGARRPSMGPANPRAMYGHASPPALDEQSHAQTRRRPSVVVLPPPSPGDNASGTAAGWYVAVADEKASVSADPSEAARGLGGGGSVAGKVVGAADESSGIDRKQGFGSESSSMSAAPTKKVRDDSAAGMETSDRSSGRGSRAQGKGAGVASSSSLLLGSGQGAIKVEKIQLAPNAAKYRRGAGEPERQKEDLSKERGEVVANGPGGGVLGEAAPPTGSKSARRSMATRDAAATPGLSGLSIQELRNLATATAARQDMSSSSDEEEAESGDIAGAEGKNLVDQGGRGVGSFVKSVPRQQQPRTTSHIDASPAASDSALRLPSGTCKHNQPSIGTKPTALEGGGWGGGKNKTHTASIHVASAATPRAAAPPAEAQVTPPPVAWSHPQADVGEDQHLWGSGTGGRPSPAAAAEVRRWSNGTEPEGGKDHGAESESESRRRGNGTARATSGAGFAPGRGRTGSGGSRARARSSSRAATSQLRRQAERTPIMAAGESQKPEISGDGEGRRRAEPQSTRDPAVARLSVKVRSSTYLIVAEVGKDGSTLLGQVMEAERLRHGQKAAKVTGLMNESTGDTVDMDVPARRSISSGDSLTALVAGRAVRFEQRSPAAPPPDPPLSTGTSGDSGTPTAARHDGAPAASRPQRSRSPSPSPSSSPRGRSPPSPLRLRVDGGSRGGDVEQLREDIARRLHHERLLAGEGSGAASPLARPIGSAPITPVTGGGRGASPESSRATSPRSASQKEVARERGRSPRREAGAGSAPRDGWGSRPGSPTRSACSAASGYTHHSGFSVRSHVTGGGKGPASNGETAFMTQSTLTPEELDGILKEELVKSRKWSALHRTAQDKIRRVWEERGAQYARLQQQYEEAEAARQEKARRRRETEAAHAAAKARQRAARAELALQQARITKNSRDSRAKEAEATHRRRMQKILDKRDTEHRKHATKVQMMDRRREDIRDSFLDMVDAENETAIQALETPLEMLDRALEEGDEVAEKKARRAILRQAARERVQVREKAARVLADQRRLEQKNGATGHRARQIVESSMMPGPGQYNLRDFSEYGSGAYSRPLL